MLKVRPQSSWKLVLVALVVIALPLGIAFYLVTSEQQRLHDRALVSQALSEARVIREALRADWPATPPERTDGLVELLASERGQVGAVREDGTLAFGSASEHGGLVRRLVAEALRDGIATAIAPTGDDGRSHALAAVRIGEVGAPRGVVWLSRPVEPLRAETAALAWLLALAGGAALLASGVAGVAWMRMRRRLVRRLVRGARDLSAGDLNAAVPTGGPEELARLAASLNEIRRRLAAQVQAIERHRNTLANLVNHLREGVVVLRTDARIRLMNPAAARLLNLPGSPADHVGKPLHPWLPLEAIRALALYPQPPGREVARQTRIQVRVGESVRTLRAHISPVELAEEGAETETVGRLLVLTDVSELVRTIQMRTDFVANASHELRTPLSTIRAASETLLAMDLRREPAEAQQFLHAIERHSARLEEMVLDLMDLSRLESPDSVFEPEALRIGALLEELHARVAEALERGGLRWEARVEPRDADELRANGRLVRLVLENLVDNAIRFTPRGGRVSVVVRVHDGRAELEVADTGCGIPADEQQRVFERFYQVQRDERSGQRRGTGLGLSIVRHAVSAMRGEVSLHSRIGEGTSVTVSIPQGEADEAAPAARGNGQRGENLATGLPSAIRGVH